jgi:hypothetical protein
MPAVSPNVVPSRYSAHHALISKEGLRRLPPDSGCTPLKRFCVKFNDRELPGISGVPDRTGGFCDVLAGETTKGLRLVIESHRCCTVDSRGKAPALKVYVNIRAWGFIDRWNVETSPPRHRM